MIQVNPLAPSTSGSPIQDAITALGAQGGQINLAPGTYVIPRSLVLPSTGQVKIVGEGAYNTVIRVTADAPAILGTDVQRLTIQDLGLTGPGAGSSNGLSLLRQAAANTPLVSLERVVIQNFGGHGLEISNPIVCQLRQVVCETNGGHGFYLHGVEGGAAGTSTKLDACYAVANKGNGYQIAKMNYSALVACAADNNAEGYVLQDCQAVRLDACGVEGTTGGSAFIVGAGCQSVAIEHPWVSGCAAVPVVIQSGPARLVGLVDAPPPGATRPGAQFAEGVVLY